MKNVINYYYGIIIREYKKRDTNFIFYINGLKYEFIEYYGDINRLLNIYSILKTYSRYSDEIIINKNNSFITYYENKPYILLKKFNNGMKNLNLEMISDYDCIVYAKEKLNWKTLWEEKLDYYEMQLEETGLKYPFLKKSFSYYEGLSEISINLLNYVNYDNINYYISHRRLETVGDLFNPLNIIIDNKTRDIAEYIKVKYFSNKITPDEINFFINNNSYSKDEIILLLARLIYPSYYFDVYEKIYAGKETEKELNRIIKRNVEYETFLKKIYNHVKFLHNIPQIEFLED